MLEARQTLLMGLKAPAEALPSARSWTHTLGRWHCAAFGIPWNCGLGGWAAQEATDFRVCSHPWGTGRRDLLLLTHPLHQHAEIMVGLEALPPCRQEDATSIPAMVPPGPARLVPFTCLLFLCLAETLPGLALGQHHTLGPEVGSEHPQRAASVPRSLPVPSAQGWWKR